jgi:hypothetical protein
MYENHSSKRVTLKFPSKELILEFLAEVFTHEFDVNSERLTVSAHFSLDELKLAKSKYNASVASDNPG